MVYEKKKGVEVDFKDFSLISGKDGIVNSVMVEDVV